MEDSQNTYRGPERRKHPRINAFLIIHLKDRDKSSTTENISINGACFLVDELFEKGEVLAVDIFIPGLTAPVEINAKIIWQREIKSNAGDIFKTGIEFIDISDDNHRKIFEYMSELNGNPDD